MSHLRYLRANRIALIKPSALGDIVHSLPVLHALRVKYSSAHITWVVNRSYAALLDGHPDLSEVLPFDRRGGALTFFKLAHELFRRRFDLVVDLQGLLRTGVMTAVTLAPRRVGLASAREGSRLAYSDLISCDLDEHAVDRYWRVAEALGVGDLPKRFHIPISDDARAWALDTLHRLPRPWLVLGVGARWVTKRWPAAHFAELVWRVQRKYGGAAIFIGAADETPIALDVMNRMAGLTPSPPGFAGGEGWGEGVESTRARPGPLTPTLSPAKPGERGKIFWPLDLTGRTTLPQLAAILLLADAVMANDTGPAHLAAALGRPVVAPYTCTKVRRHGPYGQTGGVESRVWCQGSYIKTCPRMDCMTELTPDRLWPALDEVLKRWADRCHSA